ncbi:MAG: hypothetical protein WBQ78_17870 [Gammaproteobacteria bacterium]
MATLLGTRLDLTGDFAKAVDEIERSFQQENRMIVTISLAEQVVSGLDCLNEDFLRQLPESFR